MIAMLRDRQGVALVEYALVLSIFSVVAFCGLVMLCTNMTLALQKIIHNMNAYGIDPTGYEQGLV